MSARDRHQRFPAENSKSVHGVPGTGRSRIVTGFLVVARTFTNLQREWCAEILRHSEAFGSATDRFIKKHARKRSSKSATLRARIARNKSDLRGVGGQHLRANSGPQGILQTYKRLKITT